MTEPVADPFALRNARGFWIAHLCVPSACFLSLFCLIESLGLDRLIAHALFYDATTDRWLGGGTGTWWARDLVHEGGSRFIRSIAGLALVAWSLTFVSACMRPWRRTAAFLFVAMTASIGLVGALKAVTNVDCPWNLAGFGGDRPYVALFAHRPDGLPDARCFPGAHSSSGFALVCFYFVLRDRSRRSASSGLLLACLLWAVFSLGQQARGAHFLSHDLAGAAIVWLVQLALYVAWLKPAPRSSTQLTEGV